MTSEQLLERYTPEQIAQAREIMSNQEQWRVSPQKLAMEFSRLEGFNFTKERHQQLISDAIVEADLGLGKQRIAVSMPVRHGKSELITRRTPEWFLSRYPHLKVGIVGYGQGFAEDWGRKIRDDIIAHKNILGFGLKEDSMTKKLWHTDQGGELWTAGIETGIAGRGANLLIVDDPIKNYEDARQPVLREAIWKELIFTHFRRIENFTHLDGTVKRGIIIMVMTRWHPDDPIGRVLGESVDSDGNKYVDTRDWLEIRLPAVWDKKEPITYSFGDGDWTRREGDVLCPNRMDKEALDVQRRTGSEESWECVFQQNPNAIAKRSGVYYNYDARKHERELLRDPNMSFFLACDFNLSPMSWCLGQWSEHAITHGWGLLTGEVALEVNVLDEISLMESNTPAACEVFLEKYRELSRREAPPMVHVFGDPAGHQESHAGADMSDWAIVRRFLRQNSIPFRDHVLGKPPTIQGRVEAMNSALWSAAGTIRLSHDPRCKKLRLDLETVTWARGNHGGFTGKIDPGPYNQLGHLTDALGYFVHQKFGIRGRFGPQAGSPR